MSRAIDNLRAEIRRLTAEMNEAAGNEDWQRTRAVAELRADLLETLFARVDDPAAERALVTELLESDRLLGELARTQRGAVAATLRENRRKAEVARSYLDAASLSA